MSKNIGLTKKFVQVFPQDGTENPNELFGQPNTIKYVTMIRQFYKHKVRTNINYISA